MEPDPVTHILKEIEDLGVVSVIGIGKNVGKTTAFNFFVSKFFQSHTLGLTSIGRDGELFDVISRAPKPRITIYKNTIFATANECMDKSRKTHELLAQMQYNTPLGKIMIFRGISKDYVELCGPSHIHGLVEIRDRFKEYKCNLILIDGAFSRKSFASPLVSKGTILATGASLSRSMGDIVKLTKHQADVLSLQRIEYPIITEYLSQWGVDPPHKAAILWEESAAIQCHILPIITILSAAKTIADFLSKHFNKYPVDRGKRHYLYLNGPITSEFLLHFMKKFKEYPNITIIAENATKIFADHSSFNRFIKTGGSVHVRSPINLIAIACNPFAPQGYSFDKREFINLLRAQIEIPVINVLHPEI